MTVTAEVLRQQQEVWASNEVYRLYSTCSYRACTPACSPCWSTGCGLQQAYSYSVFREGLSTTQVIELMWHMAWTWCLWCKGIDFMYANTHTHTNNQSNIKQREHVLGYEDLGLFHKRQLDRLSSVRLRTEAGNYISTVAELSGWQTGTYLDLSILH